MSADPGRDGRRWALGGALAGAALVAAVLGLGRPAAPAGAPAPPPTGTAALRPPAADPVDRPAGARVAATAVPLAFLGAGVGEAGRAVYYFTHGTATYTAAIGEAVGPDYRLDGVDATAMHLTRLADGARADLPLGGGPGSGALGADADSGEAATVAAPAGQSRRALTQRLKDTRGPAGSPRP